MPLVRLLCVLLILLTPLVSPALDRYVATGGNNSGNGNSGAPWATLQYAHDTANSGDTIYVLAGQFYQRVLITKGSLRWTGAGVGSTTVDGTDALTGWTHVASGMYRAPQPGYQPGGLNVLSSTANLSVLRWQDSFMRGDYLSCGVNGQTGMQTSAAFSCGGSPFWAGFEAAWGNVYSGGSWVYMRFRQGENPNGMSIRVGPYGATNAGTFTISGNAADNTIIENMTIVGGTHAIALRSGVDNTIIRNNTLRNGWTQVLNDGANGTQILNNTLRVMWVGANPGYTASYVTEGSKYHPTWGTIREFQYLHDKFEAADGGEHTGCLTINAGDNIVIDGNNMLGGTVPIRLDGGSNIIIRNNTISNCSAECIFWYAGSPLTVAHNVLNDGQHLIRIQRMEWGGKQGWFYRNHWHSQYLTKHVHFSFIDRAVSPNEIWFYHNTFTGVGNAADFGPGDGTGTSTMANVRYINNVLGGPDVNLSSAGITGTPGGHGYLGMWSYNHVSTGETLTGANNYVNNTLGGANPIWSNPLTDVLLPPSGHAALNSGIRLDQNWTIGTVSRSALPGMTGGYYPDTTPHKGSWQVDEGGAPLPDTTDPVVSITAPLEGAIVSGSTVAYTANATDNVGVVGVQFRLDGVDLQAADTIAPFGITWDTIGTANGAHFLTARAYDAAGNDKTSVAINVTVANGEIVPPTVALTAPASGATVSGTTVSVTADASDNVGVVGVQFKLDGLALNAEDTTAPYGITWNSTLTVNGSHTLTATARDAAGNMATSTGIPVTVSNADTTGPVVTLTSPAPGATVGGASVVVTATATDVNTVLGVQFLLDGAPLQAEDTTSPFGLTWNSTLTLDGVRTLSAVGRDPTGNLGTATPISVTVDNLENTPPTVAITAPAAGAIASGRAYPLAAVASDSAGIDGVQFQIDGVNVGSPQCCTSIDMFWDTYFTLDGAHMLTAVATDNSNNSTTSTGIPITVSNNPTGLVIAATSTVSFGLEPTSVSVAAAPVPPPLAAASTLSIVAAGTPTFPGEPSGTSIGAAGTPLFPGEPTGVTLIVE